MTGYVIVLPLFARRFSDFWRGVEALAISAMAMRSPAPWRLRSWVRWPTASGRRLVLVSLGAYILAFGGYLFASSVLEFIALRALAGAFTAGLNPAVTGIVADLVPMDRRGQWIGVVNGGAAVGWIAGPILGGMLYDRWGYGVALSVSISMAVAAFALALFKVPESHKGFGRSARDPGAGPSGVMYLGSSARAFLSTLPNPLSAFLVPPPFLRCHVCLGIHRAPVHVLRLR
jgi:MFS family permease